jgi:Zn-dependent peptidase ImmA (M78 family)
MVTACGSVNETRIQDSLKPAVQAFVNRCGNICRREMQTVETIEVNPAVEDNLGVAYFTGNRCKKIYLNPSLTPDDMPSTLTHELFHCLLHYGHAESGVMAQTRVQGWANTEEEIEDAWKGLYTDSEGKKRVIPRL